MRLPREPGCDPEEEALVAQLREQLFHSFEHPIILGVFDLVGEASEVRGHQTSHLLLRGIVTDDAQKRRAPHGGSVIPASVYLPMSAGMP